MFMLLTENNEPVIIKISEISTMAPNGSNPQEPETFIRFNKESGIDQMCVKESFNDMQQKLISLNLL